MKKSHVFIAIMVCVMFLLAIVALFKLEPPPGSKEPILILIGSLSAAFGAVMNYFFGSSSGSARKDELLAQSVPINDESTTITSTTPDAPKPRKR